MTQARRKRIDHKDWLAKAVAVLSVVALTAAMLSNWLLYEAAYKQETKRLVGMVQSQAILIETIAAYDTKHRKAIDSKDKSAPILAQLVSAHGEYPGFGETGEFTLGTLTGGNIIFLLSHRHFDLLKPVPIPWDSSLGEPMRQALRGESGTLVGLDYRDEKVLAAYEPLPHLKAGIVAKIDISEIRAPFIRAGLIGMVGVLIIIFIGAMVFRRINIPLLEREKALANLRLFSRAIDQSPNMVFITDTDGTVRGHLLLEDVGYGGIMREWVGQPQKIGVFALSCWRLTVGVMFLEDAADRAFSSFDVGATNQIAIAT